MRVLLTALGFLMFGNGVHGQLAGSETQDHETLALTGGGAVAASPDHRLWASVGLGIPLASGSVAIHSSVHSMQLGLIPTLYPRKRLGDANGDDVVDAADIVRAGNHFHQPGTWPLPIEDLFNADVNHDMRITAKDLEGITDIILGRR